MRILGLLYALAATLPVLFQLDLAWTYFAALCVVLSIVCFFSAQDPSDRRFVILHAIAKLVSAGLLGVWLARSFSSSFSIGLAALVGTEVLILVYLVVSALRRRPFPAP